MKLQHTVAGTLLLALLGACSGGAGNEEPTAAEAGNQVPASALASATAYSRWAGSLVNSDSGPAVAVGDGMTAPRSETEQPITITVR